ncbi:MAG: 2-amino-4-hydroxy-6-hydroxymethyldihydropteridine diphosphokinase [Pseudomonadota bacterium]
MQVRADALQRAFLGLGGNIVDVLANMATALQNLDRRPDTVVVSVSSVYRTPPWGIENQDWFLNACAGVDTSLSPTALLDAGLQIEGLLKRERRERWGPRTLDIDILTFGNESVLTEQLTIPHPRMHEREFVLRPLADIAPDLAILGSSCLELLREMPKSGIEKLDLRDEWWKLA